MSGHAPLQKKTGTPLAPRGPAAAGTRYQIASPVDSLEREADRAADEVVSTSAGVVRPRTASSTLSPAGAAGQQRTIDAALQRALDASRQVGSPLLPHVRGSMEQRFQDDFSDVRVHADANSAGLSRALEAEAFTTGSDIYFGSSAYSPETRSGQHLLAHELSHVVQQRAAGLSGPSTLIQRKPLDGAATNEWRRGLPVGSTWVVRSSVAEGEPLLGRTGETLTGATTRLPDGTPVMVIPANSPATERDALSRELVPIVAELGRGVRLAGFVRRAVLRARSEIRIALPAPESPVSSPSSDLVLPPESDELPTFPLASPAAEQRASRERHVQDLKIAEVLARQGVTPLQSLQKSHRSPNDQARNLSFADAYAEVTRAKPELADANRRALLERPALEQKVQAEAPTQAGADPQLEQGVADVRSLLDGWFTGPEIVNVFERATPRQFVELQRRVDMGKVLDKLDPWRTVRLAALGPLLSQYRARVNEVRADFLVDITHKWGLGRAQVFALYVFSQMPSDDVDAVLARLAAGQHLFETVDKMPGLVQLLQDRHIDRSRYRDRGAKATDVFRGVAGFVDQVLSSSPAAQGNEGSNALIASSELPGPFREAVERSDMAALSEALRPGNVAFGAADTALLGLLSGVKGVVYDMPRSVVSGVTELSQGHVSAGVEQLTGAVVAVVGLVLGVRGFRKSLRVSAMLELTPEGAALYQRLEASIGKAGIDDVARYVQASSDAQILVRERGAPALEALHQAKGDVAAARNLLATAPAPLPATVATQGLEQRLAELQTVADPAKVEASLANDRAFAERKLKNEELVADSARLQKDLAAASASLERFKLMREGDPTHGGERLPLAFESWEQYAQFKKEFAELIEAIKIDGKPISAEAKNIGTSAGFYSGNPKKPLGHHFDREAPAKMGDVDIELNSPELVRHMLQKDPILNPDILVGGKKVIFKNMAPEGSKTVGFQVEFPQFLVFSRRWGRRLKRDVDIKLKADLTPVSEIPAPSGGPIELYRTEP